MASSIARLTRLHAQVYSFVNAARSSGLEHDWIKLITGKPVGQDQLFHIDKLLSNALRERNTPSRDPSRSFAQLTVDAFTNQHILRYEIPKAVRLDLQKQALEQTKDEAKAKQIYREMFNQHRAQLLRPYALRQPEITIPPLKVEITDLVLPEGQELSDDLPPEEITLFNDMHNFLETFENSDLETILKEHISPWKLKDPKDITSTPNWQAATNPISKPFIDELQPFVGALRKSYFPIDEPKKVTIDDVPVIKLMQATIQKLYNQKVRQQKQIEFQVASLQRMMQETEQEIYHIREYSDKEEYDRFPEYKEELKRLLLKSKWNIPPTPGVDDHI